LKRVHLFSVYVALSGIGGRSDVVLELVRPVEQTAQVGRLRPKCSCTQTEASTNKKRGTAVRTAPRMNLPSDRRDEAFLRIALHALSEGSLLWLLCYRGFHADKQGYCSTK
jgi:hypothetical protein